jgi:hypothetical protein
MNNSISKEDHDEIEKSKYLINNFVDHNFVYENFGQSSSFVKEILQTEGITPEEHKTLRDLNRVKIYNDLY